MNPLKELLMLFNLKIEDVEEQILTLELKKKIDLKVFPKLEEIKKIISKFPDRDAVTLNLLDNSETIQIIKGKNIVDEDRYQQFIKENNEIENDIIISLTINKSYEDEKISIYLLKSFINMIEHNDILDIMKFFSKKLEKNNRVTFINYDDTSVFYTKAISMINSESYFEIREYNRNETLDKIKDVCNFMNNIEYQLLPEDFDIEYSSIDGIVKDKFNKIKIILSIIGLANISKIEGKKLDIQVNGYQNKNFQIDLIKLENKENYEEIYKIYKWAFSEGNISDKINLVRNVISLHCKYSDILQIDSKTFASIKSNYEIYLKENLNSYIELKNKVTEFILEASNKINDISLEFINSLKKNIVAFITFILGTILTNIVSENRLDNIFTNDIIAICYWLLIGSLVYVFISVKELNFKFDRYKNNYNQLKNSYKDILDTEDIEEIFQNDRSYKENNELIKNIKKRYTILWVSLIIITGVAITIYKNVDVNGVLSEIFKYIEIINNILKK